jgi:26S proteasome regulatory subunit N3
MPIERRSLRSNSKSDTSSSTNGEKSQTSSKDKPAPTTRAAASKSRTASAKKAATGKGASNSSGMSGHDQPHANGSDPVENGVNGIEDVEMEEDSATVATPLSGKPNTDRDGDEKITVVVPPSKGARLSGDQSQDKEGDVNMDGVNEESTKQAEVEVDPKVKAMQGEYKRRKRYS